MAKEVIDCNGSATSVTTESGVDRVNSLKHTDGDDVCTTDDADASEGRGNGGKALDCDEPLAATATAEDSDSMTGRWQVAAQHDTPSCAALD